MGGTKRGSPPRASARKAAGSGESKRVRTDESPRTVFEQGSTSDDNTSNSGMVDADAGLVAEEEKIRKEREAQEEKDGDYDPSEEERAAAEKKRGTEESDLTLDEKKYVQLNHLLDQTNLYSKFLSEQMDEIEQAVGKEEKSSKKAKETTQEFLLPLMKGGILREYQIKGVKWMMSLWQNGLNGILADQMGLGKTVQAIGFLSHLWDKNIVGPFLIVAPLSMLSNWVQEFQKWVPDIPVVLYHGTAEERAQMRMLERFANPGFPTFPVIVTSYEIAIRDAKPLQKYHYKYMVVDEGHRLKNFNCKLIRELRNFDVANKLLLTGTPLQNNLSELWSLLNFLLPDVFSSLADFERWFDFSKVNDADEKSATQHTMIVEKLHNILKPFLLRRLKADVIVSLPMKKEIVLFPTMTDHQKNINKQLLDRTLEKNLRVQARQFLKGANVSKLRNILMQMRKNCNHPDLITGEYDGSYLLPSGDELVQQCGKMKLLDRLLTKLRKKNHKVLIFSQMTKMLDLLEVYLEDKGEQACRIDGNVPLLERRDNIARFNNDPAYNYFLLSTRAGGLGINLAAADTVIIYDSDWNPQQDLQAMDRCHRIGQTKPVLVFRLITANSVEERMLAKAESKLKLERLVIKKGAFVQDDMDKKITFSVDEMKEILSDSMEMDGAVKGCNISEKDLNKLLDRSDLAKFKPILAKKGKGFQVVVSSSGAGILSNVNA
ncbi:SNF2-related ATP-dependent DNA helicase [Chloropicon primus]|uniref:SNF2-related ATP-dependent DNA helicase n=1 Tax=Chloropicon primus TaxID=1764295 RepID=A0A5B8MR49_9CHLO|nr:SNF2-related ATP-dependent DNA helicase [Chloropicon primus]UPR02031.1 SNF2-related ATP-dependent DNA helicase [Chloropicon primus]|mmetsp:Transcript_4005/g.11634  ORF Transcript_4005/g.11634 Transcript_4005/m.11634 type:complete len:717 (-) Transcript_4005:1094-3244(-)|eukprot:QDZ22807.1 SNF2-related ATP-dependent DNA helicase [Chloropicon primus]